MATTLRKLGLLSPLLSVTISPAGFASVAPSSILGNFSPHHSNFFSSLHFTHSILFLLCLPLHSEFVFVWFSRPFLLLTLELKLYGILSAYMYIYKIAIILRTAMIDDMVVVVPGSCRGGPSSVPHSSQHKIQYFHSFTISLASIFSSAFST